jgi:predicted nuclease of predicted toxin-antitoxin system
MNIKLDENMPVSLADVPADLGHDVHTTQSQGLAGCDDNTVWQAAQGEDRFLITQDLDFSDLRKFAPGQHAGILVLRLRDPGRLALLRRVEMLFRSEDVEGWKSCFVVATEHKTRVRRA